jgi:hypothetical protein
VLNDESCPLQIASGRGARVHGRWQLSIEVKNVSDNGLVGFTVIALVFDASGTLVTSKDLGAGGPVPTRQTRHADLSAFEGRPKETGEVVVLAVKDVSWAGASWRSVSENVAAAAERAVKGALNQ